MNKEHTDRLLNIKKKISTLQNNEFNEIFNIVKCSNESYSSNNNGVFFDLVKFKEETLSKIESFINYNTIKNVNIEKDEDLKEKLKNTLKI
jgi:hypothetical protein